MLLSQLNTRMSNNTEEHLKTEEKAGTQSDGEESHHSGDTASDSNEDEVEKDPHEAPYDGTPLPEITHEEAMKFNRRQERRYEKEYNKSMDIFMLRVTEFISEQSNEISPPLHHNGTIRNINFEYIKNNIYVPPSHRIVGVQSFENLMEKINQFKKDHYTTITDILNEIKNTSELSPWHAYYKINIVASFIDWKSVCGFGEARIMYDVIRHIYTTHSIISTEYKWLMNKINQAIEKYHFDVRMIIVSEYWDFYRTLEVLFKELGKVDNPEVDYDSLVDSVGYDLADFYQTIIPTTIDFICLGISIPTSRGRIRKLVRKLKQNEHLIKVNIGAIIPLISSKHTHKPTLIRQIRDIFTVLFSQCDKLICTHPLLNEPLSFIDDKIYSLDPLLHVQFIEFSQKIENEKTK